VAEQTRRAFLAHPRLAPYAGRPVRKGRAGAVGARATFVPMRTSRSAAISRAPSSQPGRSVRVSEADGTASSGIAGEPEIIEGEPVYCRCWRAPPQRRISIRACGSSFSPMARPASSTSRRIAEVFPAAQSTLWSRSRIHFCRRRFQDNSRVIDVQRVRRIVPWRGEADIFRPR